ncbi:hypothetical protein G6F23_003072 [Rhizopus arrhizus]|nr:hypothetical protein G6F23_003072 [Rhizopus arrhizus]
MADEPKKETKSTRASWGTACYRCRGFRHACDRTKPSCTRCQRRKIICIYPEAAPTLRKLQKATESLGDRIKKFGEILKNTSENNQFSKANNSRGMSLQRLAQPRSSVSPLSQISTNSFSSVSTDMNTMVSASSFSVYPCHKCYKDLQPCDLTLPSCSRCFSTGHECIYQKTEPKAKHVSQVLNTMNKVMDQWQESIDKMAKDFAQKTRDFGQRVDQSFKRKPLQPFSWKITTTNKGISVEGNVNSFNDLTNFVDQFKKVMHISTPQKEQTYAPEILDDMVALPGTEYVDDTSSIHTSSTFSFNIFNSSHPLADHEDLTPIEITQELTDGLVDLYCNTPCCTTTRLPIINTEEFLARYHASENRPCQALIFAVCAAAARNAFQFHVSNEVDKEYNVGKTISILYCLKGREVLAECFDEEPSLDLCMAVFLLAYCHMQNGYTGVLYIYEWIAFTMAHELGLYDENRELNPEENMLAWCLFYFNTWYKVFQGNASSSGQIYPRCPLQPPPPKPNLSECTPKTMVKHYIYTEWYYLIQLQVLRQEITSRLLSTQPAGQPDATLSTDLLAFQNRLDAFYNALPPEWRSLDVKFDNSTNCADFYLLANSCIFNVYIDYHINKVLLHQAFFPAEHFPTTPSAIQSLHSCLNSALIISQAINTMVSQQDNQCNIPLYGLMFANMVYIKLLNYPGDHPCKALARQSLVQSLDTLKTSKPYIYDLDMSMHLLNIMEKDVLQVL